MSIWIVGYSRKDGEKNGFEIILSNDQQFRLHVGGLKKIVLQ